jgi:hypothetical protein
MQFSHLNDATRRQSFRKAIETQVSAAVTKYNELIGCGGWDGEIEKPEQNGAILIDGCPFVEHLRKGFVPDKDVDSTCTVAQSTTSFS